MKTPIKIPVKIICSLCLPLVLISCQLKTRSEISETEDKKVQQTQISTMQEKKAEEEVRIQDFEASLRQTNGRLDAIEHRLNLDFENRQKESAKENSGVQSQKQLVDQMKIFEDSIAKLEARVVELEKSKLATNTKPGVPGKEPESNSFMEAEQFLSQKEWKRAILAYQTYREENPKGKKFADATYKIGACFQELGKKAEAKAFYEEVVEKFPKSEAARKATFRLKNLK